MSTANWLQLLALVIALAVCTPLLGNYIAAVFADPQDGGDGGEGSPRRIGDRGSHRSSGSCSASSG